MPFLSQSFHRELAHNEIANGYKAIAIQHGAAPPTRRRVGVRREKVREVKALRIDTTSVRNINKNHRAGTKRLKRREHPRVPESECIASHVQGWS